MRCFRPHDVDELDPTKTFGHKEESKTFYRTRASPAASSRMAALGRTDDLSQPKAAILPHARTVRARYRERLSTTSHSGRA